MTLLETLGIWEVDSRGRGIPLGHAAVCRKIEKLSPEEIGLKVVEQLQAVIGRAGAVHRKADFCYDAPQRGPWRKRLLI